MTQADFSKVKVGDEVLTLYKGRVVRMIVHSIYDNSHSKRAVNLIVPDSNKIILRHMYNIFCNNLM